MTISPAAKPIADDVTLANVLGPARFITDGASIRKENALFGAPYWNALWENVAKAISVIKAIHQLASAWGMNADSCWSSFAEDSDGNQSFVLTQNFTRPSINGTSISTPTTVAKAAPEDNPNNIVAVAIATSK